jgi:hypothetical protein
MKIKRTLVAVEGMSLGELERWDTIEYEGKLWLVPYWLDNPSKGTSRPGRIVCLSLLEHDVGDGPHGISYTLRQPMPKFVVDGQTPPEAAGKFVIVENPPIQVQTHERLFRDIQP